MTLSENNKHFFLNNTADKNATINLGGNSRAQ